MWSLCSQMVLSPLLPTCNAWHTLQPWPNACVRSIACFCASCRPTQTLPLSIRRLAAIGLLEQHAVALCSEAPQDSVRGIYEAVRDRTAQPALDGPEGAARAQLAALQTLTRLLVACEMQQRDARLVKVRCCTCCSCSTCSMFHCCCCCRCCHGRRDGLSPSLC